MIGNPLAALECFLKGATLYVGKVPMTAGAQQCVPCHVGSMSGTGHENRSCLEASAPAGQSVARPLAHSHDLGTARGTPIAHVIKQILSLEVDPMYLARVYEAKWQNVDVEMKKLCRRARGSHG